MLNKSIGRSFKKGSVTMEFVTLIPLLLIMILFIAQFFVAGMAVVETEVTLRDTVRYAAEIGDEKKAKRWGLNRFDASGYYDMESLKVEIKDEEVIATARTRIEWLFTSAAPFHYRSKVKTPVID
ncbi:TadE-like protein [Planifilum fulgidum]|uniref:TadE-like protein n=2 Tax=Planifilum fulgidum TaxID=201973 RepID=A0A1I2T8S5_9BACL|nr:TadE-like protein [Planifilum fulgidum]